MANRKEHSDLGKVIGAFTFLIGDILTQQNKIDKGLQEKHNWWRTGGMTLAGVGVGHVAGILPDILEPSSNGPTHRKFFHSQSFAIATVIATSRAISSNKLSPETKTLAGGAGMAYLSHIVLDAKTPFGLPII